MNTLVEIENAIDQLPQAQIFELVERLEKKTDDAWDRQIEQDVETGRLDSAAEKALSEHRAGKSTPFPPRGE